jgi:hypothetical protein
VTGNDFIVDVPQRTALHERLHEATLAGMGRCSNVDWLGHFFRAQAIQVTNRVR